VTNVEPTTEVTVVSTTESVTVTDTAAVQTEVVQLEEQTVEVTGPYEPSADVVDIATERTVAILDASGQTIVAPSDTSVDVVSVGVPGPTGPLGPTGSTGPTGPQGPSGALSGTYEHDQAVPSETWIVNHNLGYRPNVTVTDTLGRTVWGDVQHTSANQVVIEFSAAFSGKAYLS
jgi:hypothetical protein